MALFKCIKTHTEARTIERKQMTARDGTVSVVETDRRVDITPGAYGHENIQVGEVYEINGYMAGKARANTEYFKEVKDIPAEVTEEPKKTRGRPRHATKEAEDVSDSSGDTQQSA